MARNLALIEHDMALWIDARGDEGRRHLACVAGELVGILKHGNGVEIDHAVEAIVLRLQCDEFGDGAEIVAEVQIAGRLHAGEHAGLSGGHAGRAFVRNPPVMALGRRKRKRRKRVQAQAASISRICSAMVTVRWAMAKCSRSTMRPSTTITPFFSFSGSPKASMTFRDHSTSSRVGEKISLQGQI